MKARLPGSSWQSFYVVRPNLSHVPICEEQPENTLKTKIIGTKNVIDAAIENGVRKVMYVSTKEAFLKAVGVTYSNRKSYADRMTASGIEGAVDKVMALPGTAKRTCHSARLRI
ncbi:polysaccharide biosynthesis protein [Paenibacillus dendritiformis]|uniref:polysaccharide biosynthesis protein n=1 Tax=Paenibacillus dendritiformis TaxID=130049 RepID=UPI0031BAEDFC